MTNCKKFKTKDEAIAAWQKASGKDMEKDRTGFDAIDFVNWLYEDDGGESVKSPSHYRLADGRDLLDLFWENAKRDTIGFCLLNAVKYLYRKGKKAIAPEDEDKKKAYYYIESICKNYGMTKREVLSQVKAMLNKAHSVNGDK